MPSDTTNQDRGFVIEDFKPLHKNTLLGFCRVRTPSGIIFHDVGIHRSGESWWASPASKPMISRDGSATKDAAGKIQDVPIVSFATKELRDRFSHAVVDALRQIHPELAAASAEGAAW